VKEVMHLSALMPMSAILPISAIMPIFYGWILQCYVKPYGLRHSGCQYIWVVFIGIHSNMYSSLKDFFHFERIFPTDDGFFSFFKD
jgi:hypothetical protein